MLDQNTQNLVEQLTLRKLVYVTEFLKSKKEHYSGTREKVRERLAGALEKRPDFIPELYSLLDELDAWGDQRIRLRRFPPNVLAEFKSKSAVEAKIDAAGMSHLLEGKIDLTPPAVTTPMHISYDEKEKILKLVAAKTRIVMLPQPDIPNLTVEEHPGIVFKPFKEEPQKSISFAEINLDSGFALISTALVRQGFTFQAEFAEFYEAFEPLIPLDDAEPILLYDAARNMRDALGLNEIRVCARRRRTNSGGSVTLSSHTSRADMRSDPELNQADATLLSAQCAHCNCYWEAVNDLPQVVHTHVFAPEGEVSIMGQVREVSARYVLRRIQEIN